MNWLGITEFCVRTPANHIMEKHFHFNQNELFS